MLLIHENPVTLENQVKLVRKRNISRVLAKVNQEKVEYLGVTRDTQKNQKYLPNKKIICLARDMNCLIKRNAVGVARKPSGEN